MKLSHEPVLLQEVIDSLHVQHNSWYVDCTFGGGSYTESILQSGGSVISLDADNHALESARHDIKMNKNWVPIHTNFRNCYTRVREIQPDCTIAGIVFDLGLSSIQLEDSVRGFSYKYDSELDMRFDQNQELSAEYIVNTYSEEQLYDIIASYGEEERARTIAHAICRTRSLKRIHTTFALADCIDVAIHHTDLGVRSRVFQALRIEVNDEIQALRDGLEEAIKLLKPSGIISVVSFHSLEDRIIKLRFDKDDIKIINKKPIIPSESELMNNRRSRSAKLRIGEKL